MTFDQWWRHNRVQLLGEIETNEGVDLSEEVPVIRRWFFYAFFAGSEERKIKAQRALNNQEVTIQNPCPSCHGDGQLIGYNQAGGNPVVVECRVCSGDGHNRG